MIPLKYNTRSLFVRTGTTLMTVASIAFVVLVYIGVLALAGGLATTFAKSGDPAIVMVLRDGAGSETGMGLDTETQRLLAALPGVARDAAGRPLASGETVHIQILQRADGTESNVSLRGVEDAAFEIRPQVKIVEGRRFVPGKGEIVVGNRLSKRFASLSLGSELQLGRLPFHVVGIFESAGGLYSSEVWGAVTDLGETYRRPNYYSSVRLHAGSASAVPDLTARIEADSRLRVEAMPEPEYFERQAAQNSRLLVALGNGLAILMAFGACFAAANTMYAQVAVRGREIGTLRALGFPRRSIVVAFLIEAVVLGLLAGAVGALLSLPLNGISTGTMNNSTFTEVAFSLRTTRGALLGGVILAALTGVLGGALPALSASRQRITDLLREA